MSEYISDVHPVDGAYCKKCGRGFRVSELAVCGDMFEDLEQEFEFEPEFCPNCGARLYERPLTYPYKKVVSE